MRCWRFGEKETWWTGCLRNEHGHSRRPLPVLLGKHSSYDADDRYSICMGLLRLKENRDRKIFSWYLESLCLKRRVYCGLCYNISSVRRSKKSSQQRIWSQNQQVIFAKKIATKSYLFIISWEARLKSSLFSILNLTLLRVFFFKVLWQLFLVTRSQKSIYN